MAHCGIATHKTAFYGSIFSCIIFLILEFPFLVNQNGRNRKKDKKDTTYHYGLKYVISIIKFGILMVSLMSPTLYGQPSHGRFICQMGVTTLVNLFFYFSLTTNHYL
jgi:hypothetical protein